MPNGEFPLKERLLNPVCKVCGGDHKALLHDEYQKATSFLSEITCEICGGQHKTSAHESAMALLEREGKGRKTDDKGDIERKRPELERRLNEIGRRALRLFEATGEIQPSIERAVRETQERE
jgi:hypothetical protein